MAKKILTRGELGRELAKLRIDRDEQLIDMAKRMGVHTATLRNYEYGKSAPDRDFFEAILREYDVDLTRFYDAMKIKSKQVIRLDTLDPVKREKILAILEDREPVTAAPAAKNKPLPKNVPDVPDVDGISLIDEREDEAGLDDELDGVSLVGDDD